MPARPWAGWPHAPLRPRALPPRRRLEARPSRTSSRARPRRRDRTRLDRPVNRLEPEIEAKQRHHRDEAAPQRGVVADHRVLDGIALITRMTTSSRTDIWPTSRLPETRRATTTNRYTMAVRRTTSGRLLPFSVALASRRIRRHALRRRRPLVGTGNSKTEFVWADDRSRVRRDPPQRVGETVQVVTVPSAGRPSARGWSWPGRTGTARSGRSATSSAFIRASLSAPQWGCALCALFPREQKP